VDHDGGGGNGWSKVFEKRSARARKEEKGVEEIRGGKK
jgi:hypothetical protein